MVSINNTGFQDFAGTLIMETGNLHHQEPIIVPSGTNFNETIDFNPGGLVPGTKEIKAFLYDMSGNVLNQTSSNVEIKKADIQVIEVPENLEITAGGSGEVIFVQAQYPQSLKVADLWWEQT